MAFLAFPLLGFQASVSSSNIDTIANLGVNIVQLNNLHLDDTQAELDAQAERVAMLHNHNIKVMAIVYCTAADNPEDIVDFVAANAQDIPADIWQIAQEPDLSDGVPDYFGFWGPGTENQYASLVQDVHIALEAALPVHKMVMGVSTISNEDTDYFTWVKNVIQVDANSGHNLDAVGLHVYRIYPDASGYNFANDTAFQSALTDMQSFAGGLGYSVWITEFGLGKYNSPSPEFYAAQAAFVDSYYRGLVALDLPLIIYYGYNPGWRNNDLAPNPAALSILSILIEELVPGIYTIPNRNIRK